MSLSRVLKHVATPVGRTVSDVFVEGERTVSVVEGRPFPVVLFLPLGSKTTRRGREITKPQLLYLQNYPNGDPISLRSQDRLKIEAPELALGLGFDDCYRFHFALDGDAQPLGKPGKALKGFYCYLIEVKD